MASYWSDGRPAPAQTFLVEIDYEPASGSGTVLGTFQEVSGLSVSADPESFGEGGQNQYAHQRPGRMSWPNVVLKRGVIQTDELLTWFASASGSGYDRRIDSPPSDGQIIPFSTVAVSIIARPGDGQGEVERLRTWVLDRAFPVKWAGPSLVVSSTDVAQEELEIAHHGFAASA